MNEKEFEESVNQKINEKKINFDEHLNIAVVGKVSAGKSSIINALLDCEREYPVAKVGAHSGVTVSITPYNLDEHILIIDSHGLDDIRKENSDMTANFLKKIDLGLFVVTGSSDLSQKSNYEDLKNHSQRSLVILNKIDEWDDLEESAYDAVREQWCNALGVPKIFGACVKGYDPKMRKSIPMDIRGIDEIREEIFNFLETEGKAILLARYLKNKQPYASKIITAAISLVAIESFIPGSAAYIIATQVTAITSLYYLYTGKILSKSSAISIIAAFAGESIRASAFILAKSFLPPTGILDMAASGLAMVITFAMLAAVKLLLEKGYDIQSETTELMRAFDTFKKVSVGFKDLPFENIKNKEKIKEMVSKFLSKN